MPTRDCDGELKAFLDWRCTVVTSLVAEIRAEVRKDATVAVIPSVARPTGGAWYEGSDLAALADAAGIIEACFYEPGAARVKADLFDVKRRLRGKGELRGIMRPAWPDLSSKAEFLAAAAALMRWWRQRPCLLQLGASAQIQCRLDCRCHEACGSMSMMFKGKIVAITGAAGGIGQSLCRYFAAEGAVIAAIDKSPALADFVGEALGKRCKDGACRRWMSAISDAVAKAFAKLVQALGPIDILVNNAGFSAHPTFASTDPEGWHHEVNGNLNGAYYCAHAVLRRHEGKGRWIDRRHRLGEWPRRSWRSGLQRGQGRNDLAHAIAGHGIWPLQHPLQHRAARHGAHAVVGTQRAAKDPTVLETLAQMVSAGPHRRTRSMWRSAVAFLASDAAAAITGVALPVDCGLTAGNIVMTRELTLENF